MQFVHIRNLEKYHPGYKDRTMQWAKIHINMAEGDPDTENLCEIDFCRLIKIILLELRAQKPLPNTDEYWTRKGFDIKKRSMSLTIQMLQNFLEPVTEVLKECSVDKSRIDNIREDKDIVDLSLKYQHLTNQVFKDVFNSYLNSRKKKATDHAKELLLKDLQKYSLDTAIKMLENSIKNGWTGVFELKQEFKKEPQQSQVRKDPKPKPNCDMCKGSGKVEFSKGVMAQCLCVQ